MAAVKSAPPAPKTLRGWLRAHPDKSQAWLARKLGVRQSFISMLAAGQRAARGPLALDLVKLTGLPLEAFILRHPPKTRRGPPKRRPPSAPPQSLHAPKRSRRADAHTDDDAARPLAH
jgi:hypothetical protein